MNDKTERIQLFKLINSKCNNKYNERAYTELECDVLDKNGALKGREFGDIVVITDKYNIVFEIKKVHTQELIKYNNKKTDAILQLVKDYEGILNKSVRTKKGHTSIPIDEDKDFVGIHILLPSTVYKNTVMMTEEYIRTMSKTFSREECPDGYRLHTMMFSGMTSLLCKFESLTDIVEYLDDINEHYYEIPIDSAISGLDRNELSDKHVKVIFIDKRESTLRITKKHIKEDSRNTGIYEITLNISDNNANYLKYPFSTAKLIDILTNKIVKDTVNKFRKTHDINNYFIYCIYKTLIFGVENKTI